MGKFLLGFVVALILVVAVVVGYFAFGYAPAATSAPPMLFEKRMARMALAARIKKEMPNGAAIPASEANLLAGAEFYKRDCAVCHGLPGEKHPGEIAAGMFPKPPQLWQHGVTDDPVGETYWKVANGIRLSGMPAFKGTNSEDALWQVSLLLANADKLPPSVTAALQQPLTPAPAANPVANPAANEPSQLPKTR